MTVFVFVQPLDPTVKLNAVRVGYFDASNKGGSLDAPQTATYPITTLLPLNVGQYRIRVAATDASGKSGAVDVNLNTALIQAGPFKISGLLTGSPDEKGSMAAPDSALRIRSGHVRAVWPGHAGCGEDGGRLRNRDVRRRKGHRDLSADRRPADE
jgi:hypothetical protein